MRNELIHFNELQAELADLVKPTLSIKVVDFHTSGSAIDAAKAVKALKKRVEEKRKELVSPLNERVKEINEHAKDITQPLDNAEVYLKQQLAAFEVEQEKLRRIEFEKAEKERLQREAELLAKQEAERSAVADEAEVADIFGAEADAPDAAKAAAELEQRQLEERARAAQQAKDREYEIKSRGVKNARKQWQCEALDLSKVPKEFLIITLNRAAVLAAARGGVTEIPGVKLWQETTIAIGANTYVPTLTRSGA